MKTLADYRLEGNVLSWKKLLELVKCVLCITGTDGVLALFKYLERKLLGRSPRNLSRTLSVLSLERLKILNDLSRKMCNFHISNHIVLHIFIILKGMSLRWLNVEVHQILKAHTLEEEHYPKDPSLWCRSFSFNLWSIMVNQGKEIWTSRNKNKAYLSGRGEFLYIKHRSMIWAFRKFWQSSLCQYLPSEMDRNVASIQGNNKQYFWGIIPDQCCQPMNRRGD